MLEEAEELFKKKPLGYEMKLELEIYKDGFKDGFNKAKEEMQALIEKMKADYDKLLDEKLNLRTGSQRVENVIKGR